MVDGLGNGEATMRVYMANRPAIAWLQSDTGVLPMTPGDIASIGKECGNGWRKVFNVYAKLLFAVSRECISFAGSYSSWQAYRDNELLQANMSTALLFSEPTWSYPNAVTIIMGRTYAKSLSLPKSLIWLNDEFAVDKSTRTIVCPYFDYRQLSNIKIVYLVALIEELL